jgi:hypothetical protein
MAPLPVIGNCVRVDFLWNSLNGVRPMNTIHVITDGDNMEELAGLIGAAADVAGARLFAPLDDNRVCTSVRMTPLDGVSAGQVENLGTTITGDEAGAEIPNVASVVSLRTAQRGSRGRGRIYMGPVTETAADGGFIATGIASSIRTAWNDFSEALADSSPIISLGVASYTHEEVNGVTSISVPTVLATQRRRQDQLR